MKRGRQGTEHTHIFQEVLWKYSDESCCLSNPVSLSMPSPAPPPHIEKGVQAEGNLGYNQPFNIYKTFIRLGLS